MNCRDAERLLDAFFDGELDGRLMREAALHVTRCKRCEGEIADRERLQDLLAATVADELHDVDADRIWRGVEAAMPSAGAVRPASRLRLAAASTAFGGILVGRRAATRAATAEDRAFEDALDPAGEWLAADAPSPVRRPWPMAAAAALAASIAAVVLIGRQEVVDGPAAQPQVAAAPAVAPPAGGEAIALAGDAARSAPAPAVAPPRLAVAAAPGRVQVESVDYTGSGGRSLAMWTEPETDTTVIWVEDEDPAAARPAATR